MEKKLSEIIQRYKDCFTQSARVYCDCDGGGVFCGIDFECIDDDVQDSITIFAVPIEEQPTMKDWDEAVAVAHMLGNISGLPVVFGTTYAEFWNEYTTLMAHIKKET